MKKNGNVTGSKPVEGDGFPPLLVIVLDGKGGVSKSVISGTVVFGFQTLGEVMAKFDTDTTNSTLTAMYEDARLIDVRKAEWSAPIVFAISQIGNDGVSRMLLIDTGARDEARIKERLPMIATKMAAVGGRLLVIRPITNVQLRADQRSGVRDGDGEHRHRRRLHARRRAGTDGGRFR